MKITQKFKHFTMEWDTEKPDNILVDAYDVSYDTDALQLIEYLIEVSKRPEVSKIKDKR